MPLINRCGGSSANIEELIIVQNGTYIPAEDIDGYAPVSVDVQPVLQSKIVVPTTETQKITADEGFDGFSEFTVEAMPVADAAVTTVNVDENGLITATTEQAAGYNSGSKTTTEKQLSTETWQLTLADGTALDKTIVFL